MAVPKKKKSPSKTGMKRSHEALEKNSYIENKKTGVVHRPHHIDENGMYKGKKIIG